MNEKHQILKIAINSLKLNESIWIFFIVKQYIYPFVFKIVYPHDDYFKSYREITMRDIDKIMFLVVFRIFLVVQKLFRISKNDFFKGPSRCDFLKEKVLLIEIGALFLVVILITGKQKIYKHHCKNNTFLVSLRI